MNQETANVFCEMLQHPNPSTDIIRTYSGDTTGGNFDISLNLQELAQAEGKNIKDMNFILGYANNKVAGELNYKINCPNCPVCQTCQTCSICQTCPTCPSNSSLYIAIGILIFFLIICTIIVIYKFIKK